MCDIHRSTEDLIRGVFSALSRGDEMNIGRFLEELDHGDYKQTRGTVFCWDENKLRVGCGATDTFVDLESFLAHLSGKKTITALEGLTLARSVIKSSNPVNDVVRRKEIEIKSKQDMSRIEEARSIAKGRGTPGRSVTSGEKLVDSIPGVYPQSMMPGDRQLSISKSVSDTTPETALSVPPTTESEGVETPSNEVIANYHLYRTEYILEVPLNTKVHKKFSYCNTKEERRVFIVTSSDDVLQVRNPRIELNPGEMGFVRLVINEVNTSMKKDVRLVIAPEGSGEQNSEVVDFGIHFKRGLRKSDITRVG